MRFNRPRPRRRQAPGTMNKTEAKYAMRLDLLQKAGEILSYRFEALKFRLADRTFYTPDFLVVTPDQIELHEVKGFLEEDANVKWKMAAELFPEFKFLMIERKKDQWIIMKES